MDRLTELQWAKKGHVLNADAKGVEGWNNNYYRYRVIRFPESEVHQDLVAAKAIVSAKNKEYRAKAKGREQKRKEAAEFREKNKQAQEFRMPNTVKGIVLSEENKQRLTQGEKILVEGMTSAKGTPFDAYVYIDQEKKTLAFDFPEKKEKKKENIDTPQAETIEKPKKKKLGL